MTIRRHLAAGILGLLVTLSAVVVSAGQAVDAGSDASFPVVDRVTSPAINQAWNRLQELVALAARLDQPSLMGLSGTLEQASVVARPLVEGGGGVGEWFIRTSDGSTIACAVQEPPTPSPSPGTIVELVGFPAGMLEATGRDGVVRSWPLFTSRFTGVVTAPSGGSPLPYIVGGVLLLLAAWMVLVIRTRRLVRGVTPVPARAVEAAEALEADLPKDPAEAMSVLAARHESESNAMESRG